MKEGPHQLQHGSDSLIDIQSSSPASRGDFHLVVCFQVPSHSGSHKDVRAAPESTNKDHLPFHIAGYTSSLQVGTQTADLSVKMLSFLLIAVSVFRIL